MAHHEVYKPDWEVRYDYAKEYSAKWAELQWTIPEPNPFYKDNKIKVDPIEVWVERWLNELGTI